MIVQQRIHVLVVPARVPHLHRDAQPWRQSAQEERQALIVAGLPGPRCARSTPRRSAN
jgi:hypothetical protein